VAIRQFQGLIATGDCFSFGLSVRKIVNSSLIKRNDYVPGCISAVHRLLRRTAFTFSNSIRHMATS